MIQVIRPVNLLLMAFLQAMVLLNLGAYNYLFYDPFKTLFLISGTALIAAAGYIINDYFDVKIDLINKPGRVFIGTRISRRWAIILHVTFTAAGLLLTWLVNLKVAGIAALCAALLYFYSSSFKKKFLLGNLVIALLSALSVLICYFYISELYIEKILAYSFFAFISTLLREIVKDQEDAAGDELFQSKSLAISLGLRKTKRIVLFTTIMFILSLFLYVATLPPDENAFYRPYVYGVFLLLGVALPMIYFIRLLLPADKSSDFARLSRILKWVIFSGIASMLFA